MNLRLKLLILYTQSQQLLHYVLYHEGYISSDQRVEIAKPISPVMPPINLNIPRKIHRNPILT